jgi:signal transduction histidine kinase
VVRDITEKKALERRLVESERLATMGQLAGFIAHELNTPLTSIALLTSAISRHVKDEAAREKLEKINVERRRAADIIQQLLSLSKNRPVTAIETDLRSVVQTAADHAKRYRKQGVALDVDVGESPMPVVVDPLQIQEVMMHLVKNAFEATSHGNVRIRIEDRGEFHAIVVSDTGSGIPEDVLSHLFQPFYTTKASSGGVGLGLLQSKHIATGHGGTIEVTSEPGKGSTFTVFLPRRQSHEDLSRR